MPVPRLRFTVRSLIVTVAVVAVLVGASIAITRASRRAALYRQRAASHLALLNDAVRDQKFNADWIEVHRREVQLYADAVKRDGLDEGEAYQLHHRIESEKRLLRVAEIRAERFPGKIAYHRQMNRNWARAADCPWESGPLDAPPPPDPWEKIDHRSIPVSGL